MYENLILHDIMRKIKSSEIMTNGFQDNFVNLMKT